MTLAITLDLALVVLRVDPLPKLAPPSGDPAQIEQDDPDQQNGETISKAHSIAPPAVVRGGDADRLEAPGGRVTATCERPCKGQREVETMSEASAQSLAFSPSIWIVVLTAMFCMVGNVKAAEDLHSAQHVQKNISDNEHALLKGDVDVVLSFTNPRLIELMGGREAARAELLTGIVAIQAAEIELISFTFPAPPQFLSGGGNEFVVVPTLSVIRSTKIDYRAESLDFQVGMLDAVSKSWKYVGGSRINDQKVKALLLPGFPDDFKFPQIYYKTFWGSDIRNILFSSRLADGREICVSPISRDAFEANHAYTLGDDSGYFIYELDADRPSSGFEILAKAASEDAAMRLVDIYVMTAKQQVHL